MLIRNGVYHNKRQSFDCSPHCYQWEFTKIKYHHFGNILSRNGGFLWKLPFLFMKEYSVCYSYPFCHGISCQGTRWHHSRQRTQPGPGFMVLCSLKPKAARNLGFRVSDIINTGIMRLQEGVKGFDAVFPIRMVQGLSTIHQQESGTQVSLDSTVSYDIVAPGELFLCIGVGCMVVLAGPEGFDIHFYGLYCRITFVICSSFIITIMYPIILF